MNSLFIFLALTGTIILHVLINTDEFNSDYGNVSVFPKRLNQDIHFVKSFNFPCNDKCVYVHKTCQFSRLFNGNNMNSLVAFDQEHYAVKF